jgi:hypothetical protein
VKKIIVILLVVILLATTIQVAFAAPDPPGPPGPVEAACNMVNSVWEPGTGPGNAFGVKPGERGMWHVHTKYNPRGYTFGAIHMDILCPE